MIVAIVLFVVFFALTFLGVPIFISLGVAAIAGFVAFGADAVSIIQASFTPMDSFGFMALPFFIMAGKLMEIGGISSRLVGLAKVFVSRIRGGLAYTTILACAFFAALSGSGVGTCSAIGSIMYPEMTESDYGEDFSAGLVACAGGLGPIIPPSTAMVTYGVLTGVSILSMFLSGIIAGVLIAVALFVVANILCRIKGFGTPKKSTLSRRAKLMKFVGALPALGMPLIILGGIYFGIFTPTEASVVAVVYSLIVGLFIYKELKFKDILKVAKSSAIATVMVMMVIGMSAAFSWIFTRAGLATAFMNMMLTLCSTKAVFIIISMVVLLIFGVFMEGSCVMLLMAPLMHPVAVSFGINPVHYGLIFTIATTIGAMTPPVAMNIFTVCGITKLPIERVSRGIFPFTITSVVCLFIIAFWPQLVLFIPNLLK